MSEAPRDESADLDAGLARAWRDASRDEPPVALDEAIRAAARKAAHARPRRAGDSPFGGRWRVPLSVAAVLVVSATVTLLVAERDRHGSLALHEPAPPPSSGPAPEVFTSEPATARNETPPQSVGERSARAPTPSVAPRVRESVRGVQPPSEEQKARAPAPSTESSSAEKSQGLAARQYADMPERRAPMQEADAKASADEVQGAEAEPAPPQREVAGRVAVSPAAVPPERRSDDSLRDAGPPPAEEPAGDLAKLEAQSRARTKQDAGEAMLAPPPPETQVSARKAAPQPESRAFPAAPVAKASPQAAGAAQVESMEPKVWLDRILELRRQGKLEEADKSLKAFRKRYPEYPLPPELKSSP